MKKHLHSLISLGIVSIVMLSFGLGSVQGYAESSGFEPGLAETSLVSLSNPSHKEPLDPWSWYIGPFASSIVHDCILGSQQVGMNTYVGYYQNADEGQPAVNTTYYIAIGTYGIGTPCGGIYAYFTFYLPPNTSLAITQDTPMFCYGGPDMNPFTCDFTLQEITPGQYAIPSGDLPHGNAWPVASGAGWEFQIPLRTSAALNNVAFSGAINNIEAENNPDWLYPTVPLYIWPNAPGAFNKISPGDGATGLSTTPTLTWQSSSEATRYEYCYNTTNVCSVWVDNGLATTKTLSGLAVGTTYYWHVRAVNDTATTYSNGSTNATWSFKTMAPPGAFNKSGPSDGATGLSTSPTLTWEASSEAASYEYCINTTNACSTWIDNGNTTSKTLSGLAAGTTYYWHVRAVNALSTTYSNGSSTATWSFETAAAASPPGAFDKSSPNDGATDLSTSLTLTWEDSSGAASYSYCYDTTDDDACTSWVENGTATSASLTGLASGTFYYWHARAINNDGTTYSNGSDTAFWSFKTAGTASPPGDFNKSSPSNGATGRSTNTTLSWGTSSGAISYSYCYDTTDDDACTSWVDNGIATHKALSGLAASTIYYWHVSASNNVGTTYSNGSDTAFWSFETAAPGELKPVYLPLVLRR